MLPWHKALSQLCHVFKLEGLSEGSSGLKACRALSRPFSLPSSMKTWNTLTACVASQRRSSGLIPLKFPVISEQSTIAIFVQGATRPRRVRENPSTDPERSGAKRNFRGRLASSQFPLLAGYGALFTTAAGTSLRSRRVCRVSCAT